MARTKFDQKSTDAANKYDGSDVSIRLTKVTYRDYPLEYNDMDSTELTGPIP